MKKWNIKHLLIPKHVTLVDLKVVATLFYAVVGSSMTTAMVFTYLPRLVKDFGINEIDMGIYAGIIASALFAGRTVGSYFWGLLSDRVGRRKTLVTSSVLLAVFTLLFGFNWNFTWVTFARFMQGVVNGVVVVAKAAVSDFADETNQGLMMAWVLSAISLGMIIGPTLGGFLSLPHEQFPNVFSKDSIFGKYPYLLPNVVVFVVIISSALLTYFILPEHLKRKKLVVNDDKETKSYSSCDDNGIKLDTLTGILDHYEYGHSDDVFMVYSIRKDLHPTKTSSTSVAPYLKIIGEEGKDDMVMQYDKVNVTFSDFRNQNRGCCSSCCAHFKCCQPGKKSRFIELLKIKELTICVLLYAVYAFVAIAYQEIMPVYAATSRKHNGLAFSTSKIGIMVLTQGVPYAITMLCIAPKIEARWKGRKMYVFAVYGYAFFIVLVPCSSKLPENAYLWVFLITVLVGVRISVCIGFLAVNLLLNNSVERHQLGQANGLAVAVAAFFRTFSPMVLGGVYSWSLGNERIGFPLNYNFTFLFLSFLSVLSLGLFVCLPKSIDWRKVVIGSQGR